MRDRLVALWSEEQMRSWTNARVRATIKAGHDAGPAASVGKVHQATLNQRIQLAAVDLLGPSAMAWETSASRTVTGPEEYGDDLPYELSGMLRSRANSIEGGTTEVNKNIVAERVLGLPRETDQWHGKPWRDVPRT
jgi:alkylation response protein AidB-like acyl-CoA dehydrogenase